MEHSYLIVVFLLLGMMAATVPVFMSLFFGGVLGIFLFSNYPMMLVVQSFFRSMDKFALVVVLFFILCGNIMTAGSIVKKLIKVANAVVGFLPGGLAMAGTIACGLFGAISGSTVATVVAIGGFMIPALMENGYEEKFSLGIMTSAPVLGIIIPPSISMILYSMVTNVSLAGLFLTGFVPGIMVIIGFSLYSYLHAKNKHYETQPVLSFKELVAVFREGFWSLMLPVVIFGGIYSGAFTANEAAVVASVYAFIVEIFIHKDMKFQDVKKVVVSSAITSATLLIIVAGATTFGRYLTLQNIPSQLADAVTAHIHSPWVFLLAVNIMLLVVGMFMDVISATLLLTPVFIPMLYAFNIDLMHFGLLMTVNLGIGYITPPLGVSLYITGAMTNRNLLYVSKSVLPFILIQLAILAILSYVPVLVLYLPRVMGYIK